MRIGLKTPAITLLLAAHFTNAVAINTLGRMDGALPIVAALGGFFLVIATLIAYLSFGSLVRKDLGAVALRIWAFTLFMQLLWAFFKAPLDVDGLFYHLPTILEALDRHTWGTWALKLWHIQNTPKMGELPNLSLITFAGPWGWRVSQLGHFSTGILGALAVEKISRQFEVRFPSVFGLMFWMAPLAAKQMGANYVDLASWSYWLAAASFVLPSQLKLSEVALASLAVFLHAGVKISGPITSCALLVLNPRLLRSRELKKLALPLIAVLLSAATWMLPNYLNYSNPIYPIRLRALADLHFSELIPKEMAIGTDFHVPTWQQALPPPLPGLLQLFVPEPLGVYDQADGAWGFLALFALLILIWMVIRHPARILLKLRANPALLYFLLACALYFVLMPGREIPRHGFMGGFALAFLGLMIAEGELKSFRTYFITILAVQSLYLTCDRVLFRGVSVANLRNTPSILTENISDIIRFGEPQHEGRWMHASYVPALRRAEPRDVEIEKGSEDLLALYWGRKFKNRVQINASYCRWPYCVNNSR